MVNGQSKHLPASLPLSAFRPAPVQPRLFEGGNAPHDAGEWQAQRTASAEGAGFISLQTSRIDNKSNPPYERRNDYFDITFSTPERREKRLKRLRRSVWASGHLHGLADCGFRAPVCWFVTLTYAEANAWRADHISLASAAFRRWCKRKRIACRYTWVAEIQPKRCARTGEAVVHYHLMAWLPVGMKMPFWDRETTAGSRTVSAFWPHGMSQTEKAKSGVGYLMKYLSKLGEFHVFPEGLRLYGIGGLNAEARAVRAWYNLPEWAKNLYGVGELKRTKRAFLDLATGELIPSLYRCELIPGGIRLHLQREYPERPPDQVGAYSSFPQH